MFAGPIETTFVLSTFGRGFLPGCMHLVAEGKASLGVGRSVELLKFEMLVLVLLTLKLMPLKLLFLVLLPLVLGFDVGVRMEWLSSVSGRIKEASNV